MILRGLPPIGRAGGASVSSSIGGLSGSDVNLTKNPLGNGGVIGGAEPTDWGNVAGGLTGVMSARTLEADGSQTVQYTLSGTSNGSVTAIIATSETGLPIKIPTSPGSQFCLDVGIEVISISGATVRAQLCSQSAAGSLIGTNSIQGSTITAGTAYARYRLNGALTNAGTAGVFGGLRIDGVTNGVAVAAVIRINFPILNRGLVYLASRVPLATLIARAP